ncbi:MAG: FAD-dependent oxidoreductase [Spirochaetales bacterium]|nr:FAD-dependent oxidoreductase [Spirochaetales bacterium]
MSDFDGFFQPGVKAGQVDPVIVVGGGYAGLSATLQLSRSGLPVILCDTSPAFTHLIRLHKTVYRPLEAYQVPFATLAGRYGFTFRQCALNLDELSRQAVEGYVKVGTKRLPFSALVVATGGRAARPLPGTMSIDDIRSVDLSIRIKELLALATPRIAVGGGGATGLQFLFELSDFFAGMRKKVQLFLLDPGQRLLSTFPPECHDYVRSKIRKNNIFYDQQPLDSFLSHAEKVDLAFSFAGVRETLPLKTNACGQVPSLGHFVFAAGDCARYPQGMDALDAQAAVRKARLVAGNIEAMLAGRPLQEYNYQSLGAFVSLGFWDGLGWIFGEDRMLTGLPAFTLKETIEAQFLLYLAGLDTYIKTK